MKQGLKSFIKITNEEEKTLKEKVVNLRIENGLVKDDLGNLERKLRHTNLIFYVIEDIILKKTKQLRKLLAMFYK